ncbi:uncharacterized protein LOC132035211 [Lycium ferocissimum]|uniref:uncharacterized protein LOC132035211 n=1 Tax=Lycium ferocissimum TaxID=112874 RepID=UPI0028164F97|nr:uncharacterized protein LOC132035211 [Lycium ferocissimum]
MEARCLYVTVHSASDLPDVRELGRMKVYAKVSITGQIECTTVDLENGTNPEWNTTFCFIVPEENIIQGGGEIPVKIELFCRRSFSHDKYVGELNLTIDSQCVESCNTFSVVWSGSNKSSSFGTLKYSHVLGEDSSSSSSSSSSSPPPPPPPSSSKTQKIERVVGVLGAVANIAEAFSS